MTTYTLIAGAELPQLALTLQENGITVDLSAGYTFVVKIGTINAGQITTLVTKSTGITGAATAPNCTIAWTAGELAALVPGVYTIQVTATVGGLDRIYQNPLNVLPALT